MLIGTDILRSHNLVLLLNESDLTKLCTVVCDVWRERRTDGQAESNVAALAACAASRAVIEPNTAAFVQVRMPCALRDASNIAVFARITT